MVTPPEVIAFFLRMPAYSPGKLPVSILHRFAGDKRMITQASA
jgi:hypothetical protein